MIAIEQLRYVRLGTPDLAAATDFAQRILGLQIVDKTPDQVFFRSDYRDHTLVYARADKPSCTVALEVRDVETLDAAEKALGAGGYKATRGSAEEAERRKVKHFLSFADRSGNVFELVVRPLQSGWRYFAPRDAGILGLEDIALRSAANGADEALWTKIFNGRVSDWVGEAAYIRFDDAHHRLAFHPSNRNGPLAIEYAVEDVDLLMQNSYFLRAAQVRIVDGPGRRPASNQLFLTFAGPDGVLFSYVAEGAKIVDEEKHRPRQFAKKRLSFCAWGSDCEIPELQG
ncbi:VOC family protein [Microbacteriaceae bacterium K1510]|nr:VOC family protein [Microbacteriaceae bacterium K1510]